MEGVMFMSGPWHVMVHGIANAVHDDQSGPRGATKTLVQSMATVMANRPAGAGELELRAMLSLDPAMGRGGYPLLFQTGETADGRTTLRDRQHPHDAFMELSASYTLPAGDERSVFAYAGLPGEPALGPPTFMHRFSGMRIPEAPLTHHWLDSTHITFGVVTLGLVQGPWKLEGSWFNGREPDERRWNVEMRSFDSWSARVRYAPAPGWALQASYGDLRSPESLEPDVRVRRSTASVSHRAKTADGEWEATLAWGMNDKRGPEGAVRLPGVMLEGTYVLRDRHTFMGRLERVRNDELFDHEDPLHGRAFTVGKLSLGYIYDFAKTGPVKWGLGALASVYAPARELDAAYGPRPRSVMLFLQARLQ
jgi:hypothetical protein